MNIYAIIVTYNAMRRSWIDKCLLSIAHSTVPMTAIVVDNGSTDETRNYVPQHFPDAVWLPQEKNLGFGQANNAGIRYALEHDADYVLLLNQDATIERDAIEKMLPHADGLSLLTPLQLDGTGKKLDYQFKRCLNASEGSLLDDLLVSKEIHTTYPGPTRESECVIPAACWFMSVDVIKKIGGFNPLFFHYSEDDNFMQRLYYHHVNVKVCPTARMLHDRGEHGDMQAFYRNRCRRMMLRTAVDINLSFCQCVVRWLRLLKDCYISDFPQKRYHIGDYVRGFCWLIGKSRRIRQSRAKEKELGTTWL